MHSSEPRDEGVRGKDMKAAILGYGTVGSGVASVLENNSDVVAKSAGEQISVKYILDLREFPGDPNEDKVVHDIQVILDDPEVETVVETMGGVEPAFTFVSRALTSGRNVATSNKELVAKHGAELMELAAAHKVNFFFEASVGGGIPVLRAVEESLTADHIQKISGILNGTTNYMLTKMKNEGASYDQVLRQAQENGYAERDPAADVEGYDACRKIAILTSMVCGKQVDFEDIPTEGITKLTGVDFAYAKAMKGDIKLLGSSFMTEDGVFARVAPEIISDQSPLYSVNDVYNAVMFTGDMLGDVMLYGKGAGSLPTASAVVSDVIQTARNRGKTVPAAWKKDRLALADSRDFCCRFLVRIKGEPGSDLQELKKALGGAKLLRPEGMDGEYGLVTGPMKAGELEEVCSGIEGFISRMYIKD